MKCIIYTMLILRVLVDRLSSNYEWILRLVIPGKQHLGVLRGGEVITYVSPLQLGLFLKVK